jgi:hypothetical protein
MPNISTKKSYGRRRRRPKSSIVKVQNDELQLAMSGGVVIQRPLQYFSGYNSSGAGSYIQALDLYSIISSSQDWANMVGVYQFLRVESVTIQIIPNIYYYTSGSTAFIPNGAICYTSASGTPSSANNVLDVLGSEYIILDHTHTIKYKIFYPTGIKGNIATANYGAGILGYFKMYFSNTFPISITAFQLRFVFKCKWTLPN